MKTELQKQLCEKFEFEFDSQTDLSETEFLSEIRKLLAQRIAYLVTHHSDFLMQALYRIDVNEQSFKKALVGHDIETTSEKIADLVIKRQVQKLKSRQEYNKGGTHDWSFDLD